MKLPAPLKFQISNFKFQIFFYFLFSIFYFLFSTAPVAAQTNSATLKQINPYNPYLNPNTNPDVPKNLHTWTQNVMIEVMSAMTCQLTGIDPTDPKGRCLGVDQETGRIGFVEGGGGAIGVTGKMIAMLYTPPLHTGDYFKYLANNFGIAKPAQAATGFEGLAPVQSLWVAFRDVVYLLFVIVFILIGLAIMLRVRIDPRTVMTIQNQIPKIIIGILLVTFSFAIAGFLIDLMYVSIFLSYEVISQGASKAVPPIVLDKLNPVILQNATPFTAANEIKSGGMFGIAFDAVTAIFFILKNLFADFIKDFLDFLDPSGGSLLTKIATGILGGAVAIAGALTFNPFIVAGGIGIALFGTGAIVEVISYSVSGILGIIAFFIIAVALTFVLIRLWFSLIMAYVGILLDVVFAPFWITAGLLPGVPIGFTAWLRGIIANLAAFPATIIMFLLAKVFIDGFGDKPSDTDFVPPLIGDFAGTDSIGSIIGLGIIFMTPGVVAMVKAAIRAPSIPGTGLIGAAIGVGASPYMAGARATAAALTPTPKLGERGGIGAAARTIFRF